MVWRKQSYCCGSQVLSVDSCACRDQHRATVPGSRPTKCWAAAARSQSGMPCSRDPHVFVHLRFNAPAQQASWVLQLLQKNTYVCSQDCLTLTTDTSQSLIHYHTWCVTWLSWNLWNRGYTIRAKVDNNWCDLIIDSSKSGPAIVTMDTGSHCKGFIIAICTVEYWSYSVLVQVVKYSLSKYSWLLM